ncbi:hypothetical protein ABN763_14195 [Spongiivirga sp. MCCC 1A20706]|uniref:hypothetical protein n=1 Tax=Spongiivirga sp. MCCC 1A20706 TaxID=3160963 RepID=UPI00397776D0
MKKLVYILLIGFLIGSCDKDSQVTADSQGAQAIASFNGGEVLVINPAADTENRLVIGVSAASNVDRSFTLSVDEDSSLDPTLYDIQLTGIIPAGSYTGEALVTTFATTDFPEQGDALILNLVSVDGATVVEGGARNTLSFGFTVECPSFELSNIVGTATTVSNELLSAFGLEDTAADPRTVVEGPGENQITIVGGFGVSTSDDIILNIDPATGNITNGSPDGTLIFINGGTTPVPVTGISGRALTCINQITIEAANGVFGGGFAAFTLVLVVQ